MEFQVLGDIREVEVIATGRRIRILDRLVRQFGRGNWRKIKGLATLQLASGEIVEAEVHWYEAHGVGKRRMKIKRFL